MAVQRLVVLIYQMHRVHTLTMWLLLTLIAMVQIADQLLLQLQMVLHLCNFLLIMEQLISLEMYLIVCRQEVTI